MTPKLVLATVFAALAAAQGTYDISTVKPNTAADRRVMLQIQPGGRFTATGVTLQLLIQEAYDVRSFQIAGGPSWLNTDRWDIQAKAENVEDRLPIEKFRPMLRGLIEERFGLKIRRDSKEMPIYALLVAKGGSKLQANTDAPGPGIRIGRGTLDFKKVGMTMLAAQLSSQVGRTVIDKTALTGEYDFKLEYTPEPGQGGGPLGPPPPGDTPPPVDNNGPTIFTALQEQLGLRLESQKGPVDILVIDRAEKPPEN